MIEDYMDITPSYTINSIIHESNHSYKFNITEYLSEPYDLWVDESGVIRNENNEDVLDVMKSAFDNDMEMLNWVSEFEKKWR